MNRREFTKGLAAAGLAPALPLPALAKAAPAVAAAKDPMYFWANFVSRVHNKSSANMITRLLKIDAEHGAKLYAQLIADGALTAPDAYGLSQSTNPLYPEYSRVAGHGPKTVENLTKSSDKQSFDTASSEQEETVEDNSSKDVSAQENEGSEGAEAHVSEENASEDDMDNEAESADLVETREAPNPEEPSDGFTSS